MRKSAKTARGRQGGKSLSYLLVGLICLGAATVFADGTGPFGYPNLLANPDFEHATIAANSNNGNWGRFSDGKVSVTGWTGSGKAGVAKFGNSTWDPFLPDTDNYFVFIQMTKGFADGASYIEQTVTPEATGLYAFTCQYATRWTYNPNAMRLGFSVVCGNVTNELEEAVLLAGDSRFRNVMRYVTLEAGRLSSDPARLNFSLLLTA